MNFFQSQAFADFQKSIPYRGGAACLMADDACGLAVSIKHRFGLNSLWMPYGPLGYNRHFFEKLADYARSKKALFARIEPPRDWKPQHTEDLRKLYDIRSTAERSTPQCSLVIDLTKSDEQILEEMKPKGRYNIKVAQKHGVSIACYDQLAKIPDGDFTEFYELLGQTGERDGFGIHPAFFYKQLMAICGPRKMAAIFLAYKDGAVIAGLIGVYFKNTATYYYGASDHSKRHYMAPYVLHWEVIRDARERGMKYYDFFGIAPENQPQHPWRGVGEFKKKFGGEIIHYPAAFDIVYRPILYSLVQRLK